MANSELLNDIESLKEFDKLLVALKESRDKFDIYNRRFRDYVTGSARIYWIPSDMGVSVYIEGSAPTLPEHIRTLVLTTWLENRALSTSVLEVLKFIIQTYESKIEELERRIRGEINKPQEQKRGWVSALLRGDD